MSAVSGDVSSHVPVDALVDVLVVGGGPVGLAAAIEARMAGLSATIIEPRAGPIDKACGEGLMPGALPLLARWGVHPVGHPIVGIRYCASPGSSSRVVPPARVPVPADSARSAGHYPPERALRDGVEHRFSGSPGLGVRRTVLQAALAARALALGVDFVVGKAETVGQDADSVTVGFSLPKGAPADPQITARWLLGCDGLHSNVARMTGLALPVAGRGRRYGIRQHFAVQPWSDFVEVHYAADAELYVTPVADNLVGIAMLGSPRADFDRVLASVPAVAERLNGAAVASERRGAGPFRQQTRARTTGRVLLVGDASGYVDALTGEGLRLGFAQAVAAIGCIVDGEPGRYEGEWKAVTRDFRMLTSGLVAWAGSPLRSAIVPAAAAAPRLFGAVVERLAR